MPRITHVKKAQQRYATVPVRNADGSVKKTPVLNRSGQQKTSKRGPVFRTVTERDLTRPKPLLTCDYPGCQINGGKVAIGSAYKYITPKSGPYGGFQRNRHEEHPNWHQWEYSNSLSAQIARVEHEHGDVSDAASVEDVEQVLSEAAEAIREIAEQKNESADSVEDGFGHETQTSMDLREVAESLEAWADEIEATDVPELPEPEEQYCEDCDGSGETEVDVQCQTCDGEGTVLPDEPTEDQMDDWRDSASDAVNDALANCPV